MVRIKALVSLFVVLALVVVSVGCGEQPAQQPAPAATAVENNTAAGNASAANTDMPAAASEATQAGNAQPDAVNAPDANTAAPAAQPDAPDAGANNNPAPQN